MATLIGTGDKLLINTSTGRHRCSSPDCVYYNVSYKIYREQNSYWFEITNVNLSVNAGSNGMATDSQGNSYVGQETITTNSYLAGKISSRAQALSEEGTPITVTSTQNYRFEDDGTKYANDVKAHTPANVQITNAAGATPGLVYQSSSTGERYWKYPCDFTCWNGKIDISGLIDFYIKNASSQVINFEFNITFEAVVTAASSSATTVKFTDSSTSGLTLNVELDLSDLCARWNEATGQWDTGTLYRWSASEKKWETGDFYIYNNQKWIK